MLTTFLALLQHRAAAAVLLAAPALALAQTPNPAPPAANHAPPAPATNVPSITIRILNARTNKPIPDEKLNISLTVDQVATFTLPTDKAGLIVVPLANAQVLRILANRYADCRSRGELYTNYSLSTILNSGITTGNLCSSASPAPKPGILLLYEIPKSTIPTYGQQPGSYLPHSDENPHVPGPPPPQ